MCELAKRASNRGPVLRGGTNETEVFCRQVVRSPSFQRFMTMANHRAMETRVRVPAPVRAGCSSIGQSPRLLPIHGQLERVHAPRLRAATSRSPSESCSGPYRLLAYPINARRHGTEFFVFVVKD